MNPERWQLVSRVYQSALEQAPEARASFLSEACRDDSGLRREVESLLAQDQTPVLVDRPVDVAAAAILGDHGAVLQPNDHLGPYRIEGLLGAGGMGQVYRAHDAKLQRAVALKILPESFVHDPDRLARFRREAQVLASLNHPNIGAIYGFEDSGPVHALVLELIEGPTLADRIARGPIPLDEALAIARQIAEALQAAHEHGIIHRDLKPANIKVRDDGTVKVLDFGLAKAAAGDVEANLHPALTQSPTILSPAMTAMGVILGTAAYMSPEQAKGKRVDKRSDVWAFGCVLYEMLTGTRAFGGEDVSDTLAAVLRADPDWAALPASAAPLRTLIAGCLEKESRNRIADISTVLYVTRQTDVRARQEPATHSTGVARLPWAIAVGVVVLASIGMWWMQRRIVTPVPPAVTRFEIQFPSAQQLYLGGGGELTLSPDGRTIFFIGTSNAGLALYRRPLDQLAAVVVPGTEGTRLAHPSSSPDGSSVAFYKDARLTRIPSAGGAPVTVSSMRANFGLTWADDRTLVFNEAGTRLWRIPATGGAPIAITPAASNDAIIYRYPAMAPGGSAIAYTRWSGTLQSAKVAVRSLRTNEERILFDGSNPRLTSSGHLLFARDDGIWATAFNAATLQALGEPVRVLENVTVNTGGLALLGISTNGTLAYVPGGIGTQRTLVWVDRDGREEALGIPSAAYFHPRISPDGRRIAVTRAAPDGTEDVWLVDATTGQMRRVTSDPASDLAPVWTPDSRALVFASNRGGTWRVLQQLVDAPEGPEEVAGTPAGLPLGFSPDGALIVVPERKNGVSRLIAVDRTGLRQRILLERKAIVANGTMSPNGMWLAYESDESGQSEIYIAATQGNQQFKVSTEGGAEPMWSADGNELFYRGPDDGVTSVAVRSDRTMTVGTTSQLLTARFFKAGRERLFRSFGLTSGERQYDVSKDGRRFLMLKQPSGGTIVVVQNWFEELKQRVPVP